MKCLLIVILDLGVFFFTAIKSKYILRGLSVSDPAGGLQEKVTEVGSDTEMQKWRNKLFDIYSKNADLVKNLDKCSSREEWEMFRFAFVVFNTL